MEQVAFERITWTGNGGFGESRIDYLKGGKSIRTRDLGRDFSSIGGQDKAFSIDLSKVVENGVGVDILDGNI